MKKNLQSPIPPGTNFIDMAAATDIDPSDLKFALRGPGTNPDLKAIQRIATFKQALRAFEKSQSHYRSALILEHAIELASTHGEISDLYDLYEHGKLRYSYISIPIEAKLHRRYRELFLKFVETASVKELRFWNSHSDIHTEELNHARMNRMLELVNDHETALEIFSDNCDYYGYGSSRGDSSMYDPFLIKAIELGTPTQVLKIIGDHNYGIRDGFEPEAPACRLAIQKILPLFQPEG